MESCGLVPKSLSYHYPPMQPTSQGRLGLTSTFGQPCHPFILQSCRSQLVCRDQL